MNRAPWSIFIPLHFLRNLQKTIIKSVYPWQILRVQCYVKLAYGPICKFQRKWSVVNRAPKLTKGPVSKNSYPWQTLRVQYYVTFTHIGTICKFQRKWSVVNIVPVALFTALHYLHNLQKTIAKTQECLLLRNFSGVVLCNSQTYWALS